MKLQNGIRHGIILIKTLFFRSLDWAAEHRELVTYVIFGGLTTVVDWGISFLLYLTKMNTHVVNVIAWTVAVLFAFVTNKRYVFQSRTRETGRVAAELIGFAGGRVLSLGVQEALFVLLVDVMTWDRRVVKVPVAVLVVIINYFLTRVVFRRKRDPAPSTSEPSPETLSDVRVRDRRIVIGGDRNETPPSHGDET